MPDREIALQMEGRGFTTRVLMLENSKEAAEFRAGEISNSTYCFPILNQIPTTFVNRLFRVFRDPQEPW